MVCDPKAEPIVDDGLGRKEQLCIRGACVWGVCTRGECGVYVRGEGVRCVCVWGGNVVSEIEANKTLRFKDSATFPRAFKSNLER